MPGLVKQKQTKLEDSNLANYGGADHKAAKEAKAKAEVEFKGAGAAEGIEIWRIENFGVKKWDKLMYGKFFSGDSYIVLNTYKKEQALKYNVHFWLGSGSSQDERGTAAFKTVELDDLLGDLPVQYREVEGHESRAFLKVFNDEITYLEGGIDSAFNKVSPTEYKPRLMHFKGRRRIRVVEVKLELASLNQGDVFLLDNGLELIQWNGPSSSPRERRKAMQTIAHIKDERNGRPKSRILDGDEDDEVFWTLLGGKGTVAPADQDDTKVAPVAPKIFSVSDASGRMLVEQVAEGKSEMKRSALNDDDCFIVDIGTQVFIWVGSGANKAERKTAMQHATQYLSTNNRPMWTPVTRVLATNESAAFKSVFGAVSM